MNKYASILLLSASFAAVAQDIDHCAPLSAIASCVSGTDESGGRYVFVVPYSWTGDLVVYSKPSGAQMSGPNMYGQFLSFRDAIVAEGYAVGYLDTAGGDYKSDSQQSHRLTARLTELARKPEFVFLTGESRGGVLTIDLAETYPEQYAGALPMCAPALGFSDSTAKRVDVRVLFDYFFTPQVVTAAGIPRLLETPVNVSPATWNPALYALVNGPGGDQVVDEIARVMKFPEYPDRVRAGGLDTTGRERCIDGASARIGAVISPIQFLFTQDQRILSQDKVRSPYDNTKTVYSGSQDDVALNAGIERLQGNRSAMNHQAKYYTPTGEVRIPILLLHNRFDPLGTLRMNEGYEALVTSAGREELLARWTVDRAIHCWFTLPERLAAFHALVAWVKDGNRPASGPAQGTPPGCEQ